MSVLDFICMSKTEFVRVQEDEVLLSLHVSRPYFQSQEQNICCNKMPSYWSREGMMHMDHVYLLYYTYNLTPVPEGMCSTSEHLQAHWLQHQSYLWQQAWESVTTINTKMAVISKECTDCSNSHCTCHTYNLACLLVLSQNAKCK